MNEQFYYAIDGKRNGPVSFDILRELASKAEVKRTDRVWCRGMKAWQTADSVDKLFDDLPPDLEAELSLTPPPLPPETALEPAGESGRLASTAGPVPQEIWNQPEKTEIDSAAAQFMKKERQIFIVGYPLGLVFIIVASYFARKASADDSSPDEITVVICLLLGVVGMGMALFNWMKLHHRLWKLVPPALAPTSPGKAVGFYFIPLFNVYWAFITFDGLAAAANKTLTALKETKPKCNEGLAIAFTTSQAVLCSGLTQFIPVLSVVVSIVAYVLWILWYGDLAKTFVVIERHAKASPSQSLAPGMCVAV